MTPEQLKHCPFCGGAAKHLYVPFDAEHNAGGEYIACGSDNRTGRGCGASTNLMFSIMDAAYPLLVEKWNSRAAADPNTVLELLSTIERQREVMRQALEALKHCDGNLNAPVQAWEIATVQQAITALQGALK